MNKFFSMAHSGYSVLMFGDIEALNPKTPILKSLNMAKIVCIVSERDYPDHAVEASRRADESNALYRTIEQAQEAYLAEDLRKAKARLDAEFS